MEQAALAALLNNAALLLVLSVIFEIIYFLPPRHRRMKPVYGGLMISLICVAVMLMPFTFQPGVIYDTRSILISVAALIFGPIPTAITAAAAIILRLIIGGVGTVPGIAAIMGSALIGLAWRRWVHEKSGKWRWLSVFFMSVTVHIAVLACMFLLPYPDSINIIRVIALPVMLVYPLASILLSLLLFRQQDYQNIRDELKSSEERFRALFDKAPLGYQSLDIDGNFVDVNQQWLDTLGYSRDEVVGKWFGDFLAPDSIETFRRMFPVFMAKGQIHSEFVMLHKGGNQVFVSFEGKIGYGKDGKFSQTHCILQDITKQREAEEEKERILSRLRSLLDYSPSPIVIIDEKGRIIEMSAAAKKILGLSDENVSAEDASKKAPPEMMGKVSRIMSQPPGDGQFLEDIDVFDVDGKKCYFESRVFPIHTPDRSNRLFGYLAIDVTQRIASERALKEAAENLHYLSNHDFLTGLYNRRFYEAELQRLDNPSQLPLTIMFGDINGVKHVNDAFGHTEGDRLIVDSAEILSSCCRSEDTVARIGGDEFGILMPKTDTAEAMAILSKIYDALNTFDANTPQGKFMHSISLGFSTKAAIDEDISRISSIAEQYMYERKLLERNSSHSAVISSIKATLSEKSHETAEHAERLAVLLKRIAIGLNLPQKDRDRLELLATLHDIGKIGISENVLSKREELSDDEWVEMKKHPEIGYRIAISTPNLIPIAESILCHHEWWDGSGYPHGLSGENIPLLSRILSIADAYDAMTQDRVYRLAMTHEEAIAEIRRCAGTQFDPQVVQIMIDNMR